MTIQQNIFDKPKQSKWKPPRIAIVQADGTVKFEGENEASQNIFKHLSSYTPATGDRVFMEYISGSYVILGKVV